MTLIELFDAEAADNVLAALAYRPDRVIYLGNAADKARLLPRCQSFFALRKLSLSMKALAVDSADQEELTRALDALVREEGDCLIDLIGGKSTALVAAGRIYERYPHRVRLVQEEHSDIPLSVEEQIALSGGKITSFQAPASEELTDGVWSVCRQDPENWNRCVALLNANLKKGEDGVYHWKNRIPEEAWTLLKALEEKGLLEVHGKSAHLRFPDKRLPALIFKAGTALEMKLLRESLREGRFTHARSGVTLDWDGVRSPTDTVNEVDLVLMQGAVPLFISCKNGLFDEDELYKLATVTDRFGGRRAKKALFATSTDRISPQSLRFLQQRAKDMKIHLVTGVHRMDDDQLARQLCRCISDSEEASIC